MAKYKLFLALQVLVKHAVAVLIGGESVKHLFFLLEFLVD